MNHISKRVVVPAVVAVIAAAALFVTLRDDAPHTSIIHTSMTFDVTNLPHLAGYAEDIFVGEVRAIEGVEDSHTQYRVAVEETIKGDLSGDVVVSQLGYVSGNETHVTDDQPLLEIGKSYLLVTNPDTEPTGWHTLISGAASAVSVDDSNRNGVIERYRGATARQQYPPGLPPKPESEPDE